MTDMTDTPKTGWMRRLPLLMILAVAAVGALTLRDFISFEALRDTREALIAYRDSHLVLTIAGFVLAYIVIVAFSLPGALIATQTALLF